MNDEIIEEIPEEIIEETLEETPEVVEEEVEEEVEEAVEEVEPEIRKSDEEKVDYGEDIDPDDIKTIGTIVDKQTAGFKKQLQDTQDKLEIDSFIQDNPEFSKYKSQIMKYVQHPVYSKIPVKNIASMVASNDLLKMGAKMEREAQAKADATKAPGTTARTPIAGAKDWSRASSAEVEAERRRVMGMR